MRNATLDLRNRAILILYLHFLGCPISQISRNPGVAPLSRSRVSVIIRRSLLDPTLVAAGKQMLRVKGDETMRRLWGEDAD